MNKPQEKYFRNFAEKECRIALELVKSSADKLYDRVLIIPAFDENFEQLQTLLEQEFPSLNLLIILIVNEPAFSEKSLVIASEHIKNIEASSKNTQELFNRLIHQYPEKSANGHLSLRRIQNGKDLLLIGRIKNLAIAYEEGVGKARKIANDCGSILCCHKLIRLPVLFNTDADALLPANYFQALNYNCNTAAWLYHFEHETHLLANIYEKSLHHYVEQLKRIHSPYAFHTIGSTMALNMKHYIQARGYPKRNAGEDFYLLNKLKKLGKVDTVVGATLKLSARASHRVPFGTGPALQKLEKQPSENTLFYHPDCFTALEAFQNFWLYSIPVAEQYQTHVERLNTVFAEKHQLASSRQTNTHDDFIRIFHERFDAFQILKAIHILRDEFFPSLSLEALETLQNHSEME